MSSARLSNMEHEAVSLGFTLAGFNSLKRGKSH